MKQVDTWILQEKGKAINYLLQNGFSFNKIKGFYWKKLQFNNKTIYLRVVLPKKFPLEYPKFYTDQKEWFLKYPHVEVSKEYGVNICYVDKEDKVAIFDGVQLIEKELKKIYEIIKSYEKNSFNQQDFLEEFDSYWGENFIYLDVQSNIEKPKIIDLLEVQKFKEVVTTDIDKTKVFLENMNLDIQKEKK